VKGKKSTPRGGAGALTGGRLKREGRHNAFLGEKSPAVSAARQEEVRKVEGEVDVTRQQGTIPSRVRQRPEAGYCLYPRPR